MPFPTSSGASGIWRLRDQFRAQAGGDWPAAVGPPPLILDTVSVAPSGAFGSWRLRTAYAGAGRRTRRSSDNSEQDTGFSGDNLDTAGELTFAGGGDGFTSKLYDQSGNARDLAQPTAALQPKVIAAGSNYTLNGIPTEHFIGGSDMKLTSAAGITSFFGTNSYTLIVAGKFNAGPADDVSWRQPSVARSTQGNIWISTGLTRLTAGHYDGGEKSIQFTGIVWPLTAVVALQYTSGTPGTIKAWLNGGAGSTLAANPPLWLSESFQIGSSNSNNPLNGDEIFCATWSGLLPLADLNAIGSALATMIGISWTTAT